MSQATEKWRGLVARSADSFSTRAMSMNRAGRSGGAGAAMVAFALFSKGSQTPRDDFPKSLRHTPPFV
jgi:hypothetical protein